MADKLASPQFRVELGSDAFGSKVFFEGEEIANVTSVKVENALSMNDPVKARIIIDLCEPVPLTMAHWVTQPR